MKESNWLKIVEYIQESLDAKDLIKIRISSLNEDQRAYKEIKIRLVEIKNELNLQFVYHFPTKAITKNLELSSFLKHIKAELAFFRNITITRKSGVLQYQTDKNKFSQHKTKSKANINIAHDRVKKRHFDQAPFMKYFGLINEAGNIVQKHKSKVHQINKFIELLELHLLKLENFPALKITDMGCGKGYLTFALQYYLGQLNFKNLEIVGLEQQSHLVESSNSAVNNLSLQNLKFIEAGISNYQESSNVCIALHACNTATDDAIAYGVKNNCELIVCAPCCYQELRPNLLPSINSSFIEKFGILKERQVEILTDLLRSMLLEINHYKVKIVEFVPSEHTPKNLLLIAIKEDQQNQIEAKLQKFSDFKKTWGITTSYLEKSLQNI